MITWIIVVAIVIVILFLLDREIYRYEGIHIGSRLQAWLYDSWAKKFRADSSAWLERSTDKDYSDIERSWVQIPFGPYSIPHTIDFDK